MAKLSITTHLEASPETVWEHVKTPQLLEYVAKGMIKFKPVDPPKFPDTWSPREYKANMYWKGFLLMGQQVIGIELPPSEGQTRLLRDNGRGTLIQVWDHMIEITPEDGGTRYTDQLTLKAGLLTPFIWVFANLFYRHRQKRWRKLVANNFDFSK